MFFVYPYASTVWLLIVLNGIEMKWQFGRVDVQAVF